jgi:uncharacterized RDD family membrane protein YckC
MSSQSPPPDQPGGGNPPAGWQPSPPEQPGSGSPGGWQPAPPAQQPGGSSPGGWQPAPPPQQPTPAEPSGAPGGWQPPGQPGWQPSPPPTAPPGAQPGYPQAPPPPSGSPYGTPAWATGVAVGRPAGFWIRVVAYIIDAVIVGVFNFVWTFIVTLAAGGSITGFPAFLVFLIEFLVGIGYFAYLWSSRGQTIGMMATGLRVTRSDGSPLTLGRGIGRALALYLSFLILFIGVIMVAFTQRKQGLHDMIADTVVVHNN